MLKNTYDSIIIKSQSDFIELKNNPISFPII